MLSHTPLSAMRQMILIVCRQMILLQRRGSAVSPILLKMICQRRPRAACRHPSKRESQSGSVSAVYYALRPYGSKCVRLECMLCQFGDSRMQASSEGDEGTSISVAAAANVNARCSHGDRGQAHDNLCKGCSPSGMHVIHTGFAPAPLLLCVQHLFSCSVV